MTKHFYPQNWLELARIFREEGTTRILYQNEHFSRENGKQGGKVRILWNDNLVF